MRTTIDAAGRIVVPKPLRELIGLRPGQELDVSAVDGRLEIAVTPTPMHLERRGRHLVAVADTEVPELTAEAVRETLEQTRR